MSVDPTNRPNKKSYDAGRIAGLREAAEIARLRERVSTLASDAIRAAADKLEAGN